MKHMNKLLAAALVALAFAPSAHAVVGCQDGRVVPDDVVAQGQAAIDAYCGAGGNTVPEPGTLALMGLALAGAVAVARKRK